MVLLSPQGMPVAKIAKVTFTSADRVRDVLHKFTDGGFDSLSPKYRGGRPRTFTAPGRREIKKVAKSKPAEHGLPFSTWSLAEPADFLVAEGVVDDISHEGLRALPREEGHAHARALGRYGFRGPVRAGPRPERSRAFPPEQPRSQPVVPVANPRTDSCPTHDPQGILDTAGLWDTRSEHR